MDIGGGNWVRADLASRQRHCSIAESSAEILPHVAVDSGFLSLVDLVGEGLPGSGITKYGIWPSQFRLSC